MQRAQILLRYSQGETVSAIATVLRTHRPKIERCLSKALQLGVRAALEDLPGRGRPARISDEEKTWVVNLACQKPKQLGYAQELWTTRLLAKHIRNHGRAAGHEHLAKLGRGTVSKILAAHPVRPHKLEYYLERRDPEFASKMIDVLHVYREVEVWRRQGLPAEVVGVLSYDEKPGIQAIGNTAPDLPRCRAGIARWGEIMNTSGTVPCRCWPASICSVGRFWVWSETDIGARSSWNSCNWRTSIILLGRAFAWCWIITPLTSAGKREPI